jgi:hypothetical protein
MAKRVSMFTSPFLSLNPPLFHQKKKPHTWQLQYFEKTSHLAVAGLWKKTSHLAVAGLWKTCTSQLQDFEKTLERGTAP